MTSTVHAPIMRGMANSKDDDPKTTEQTESAQSKKTAEPVVLPDKPFNDLTDEERAALTVAQLKEYHLKAKQDQKRKNRDYRNLMNKLKKETEAAEKAPWEDRGRRNQFLYRLGVGLSYHLSKLNEKDQKAVDELFGAVLKHVAKSDYQFTSDYFTTWRSAGCPLTSIETENKVRDKRAAQAGAKNTENDTPKPPETDALTESFDTAKSDAESTGKTMAAAASASSGSNGTKQ